VFKANVKIYLADKKHKQVKFLTAKVAVLSYFSVSFAIV